MRSMVEGANVVRLAPGLGLMRTGRFWAWLTFAVGAAYFFLPAEAAANPKKYLPVEIKCPGIDSGTFSQLAENKFGSREYFQAAFGGGGVSKLLIRYSGPGSEGLAVIELNSRDNLSDDDQTFFDALSRKAHQLVAEYCEGPALKDEVRQRLIINLKSLRT